MPIRQQFHESQQNPSYRSALETRGRITIRRISSRFTESRRSRGGIRTRIFSHHSIVPKQESTLEKKFTIIKLQNSADLDELHYEYTNMAPTICDSDGEESKVSCISFEEDGTPVSKTKRPRNGFHVWVNKVHYYQKKKLIQLFGHYKKNNNDRSEENNNRVEEIPEDPFSCYNQYRTQNFNKYFDAFKEETNVDPDNDLSVPVFSPLNELTFENLQKLKNQVFGVNPEFSDDSSISLVDRDDKTIRGMLGKFNGGSDATGGAEDVISSDKTLLGSSETEDKVPNQIIKELPCSSSDTVKESFLSEEAVSYTSNHFMDSDEESEDVDNEFFLNEESEPKSPYLLVPIEQKKADEINRTRSVIQKVKSAFRSSGSSNPSSRSASNSSSNYSAVSIAIPALKSRNLVFDISGEISEGNVIDSVYFPSENLVSASTDENTPIDIKNPRFYTTTNSTNSSSSEAFVDTTIKFDKFAQILFYDGSKRLKYSNRDKNHRNYLDVKNKNRRRADLYKNNGTLRLTPANSSVNKPPLRNAKFSRITSLSSIDRKLLQQTLSDVKPILKSKCNKNADVESLRAQYCDDVGIDDFIEFFEAYERKRIASEPYLDKAREGQLSTYYYSENCEDDIFDEGVN